MRSRVQMCSMLYGSHNYTDEIIVEHFKEAFMISP